MRHRRPSCVRYTASSIGRLLSIFRKLCCLMMPVIDVNVVLFLMTLSDLSGYFGNCKPIDAISCSVSSVLTLLLMRDLIVIAAVLFIYFFYYSRKQQYTYRFCSMWIFETCRFIKGRGSKWYKPRKMLLTVISVEVYLKMSYMVILVKILCAWIFFWYQHTLVILNKWPLNTLLIHSYSFISTKIDKTILYNLAKIKWDGDRLYRILKLGQVLTISTCNISWKIASSSNNWWANSNWVLD